MREVLIQINNDHKPTVESLIKKLERPDSTGYVYPIKARYYEAEIVDEVFYPVHKKAVVCRIPENHTVMCLINNFDRHNELRDLLDINGIDYTDVTVRFL